MSRGELIIDDNQVKPAALSSPGDWATEYQQQYSGGRWADEYARDQASKALVQVWLQIRCSAFWQQIKQQKKKVSVKVHTFVYQFI